MNHENRVRDIILSQDWLMDALRAVRTLGLPDWYIAAGAVRNTIWDVLHGFEENIPLKDIDVIYFDSSDMAGILEKESATRLRKLVPSLEWDVVNQARGHLFQHGDELKRPPVKSSCESIAYWSETPTCVGVRLEDNDNLTICAPHGLYDLMELKVKPVPLPFRDLSLYKRRINEKEWEKRWYNLQIEKIV